MLGDGAADEGDAVSNSISNRGGQTRWFIHSEGSLQAFDLIFKVLNPLILLMQQVPQTPYLFLLVVECLPQLRTDYKNNASLLLYNTHITEDNNFTMSCDKLLKI